MRNEIPALVDDPSLWPIIRKVHSFGPRVMGEILDEIGRNKLCGQLIEDTLTKYSVRLTKDVLQTTGGDRLPAFPPMLVPKVRGQE